MTPTLFAGRCRRRLHRARFAIMTLVLVVLPACGTYQQRVQQHNFLSGLGGVVDFLLGGDEDDAVNFHIGGR